MTLLLREVTGDEDNHIAETNNKPTTFLDKAEKLLLKGFVVGLSEQDQDEFYKNVPYPSLTNKKGEYSNAIKNGTIEEKILASKRINSEARTKTRSWDNYHSHLMTITVFLEDIDGEDDKKVLQELIAAVVFICNRHLPDLRTKPYLEKALESKNATMCWLGLMGLSCLYVYSEDLVLKMQNDKSEKVRQKVEKNVEIFRRKQKIFPSWMFDEKNYD